MTDTHRQVMGKAWATFVELGIVDESVVRKEIAESWKRCRKFGVNPRASALDYYVDPGEEEKIRRFKRRELIIGISNSILDNLFPVFKSFSTTLHLFDEDGFVLQSLGEDTFNYNTKFMGPFPGRLIQENRSGTLASTVTIATGAPSQVIAEEHFCRIFHDYIGSAAPIFDANHRLHAVLFVGELYEYRHPLTLGLIVATAKAIENQLKLAIQSDKLSLSNEYLKAVISQIKKSLILFDNDNRIVYHSDAAQSIMENADGAVQGKTFHELLPYPNLAALYDSETDCFSRELILEGKKTNSRHLITIQKILDNKGNQVGKVITLEEMKDIKKLVHRIIGASARYTFTDLVGDSPGMKEIIQEGLTASRSNSNLLIIGETGTGKELVAQSVHNASRRKEGPFLDINCAAMPIDLIESELFGYEEGTFTGASRKGRPGKFELADEGTIFLDEIDKMPLEVQAKLLRVLETRRVIRLGGNQYIPVDVRIIAASNTPLRKLIDTGNFREDLYYRLNVLQITIPPLRERKRDIPLLVGYFVKEKSKRIGKTVSRIEDRYMDHLCSLDWPGNVRELENFVERSLHNATGDTLSLGDIRNVENHTLASRGDARRMNPAPVVSVNDRNLPGSDARNLQTLVGRSGAAVYRHLEAIADPGRRCQPTQKEIADATGYSISCVNRTLRILDEKGLIMVEKRNRYHCTYHLPPLHLMDDRPVACE